MNKLSTYFLVILIPVLVCNITVLSDWAEVKKALNYNQEQYNSYSGETFKSLQERQQATCGRNKEEIKVCKNIFQHFRDDFENGELPVRINVEDEIKFCGKVDISRMEGEKSRPRRNPTQNLINLNRELSPEHFANANQLEYPWTVYIETVSNVYIEWINRNEPNENPRSVTYEKYSQDCTGFVIHHRFVLTTAHCGPFQKVIAYDMILLKSNHKKTQEKYIAMINEIFNENSQLNVDDHQITVVAAVITDIKIFYGNIEKTNTLGGADVRSESKPIVISSKPGQSLESTNVEMFEGYINVEVFQDGLLEQQRSQDPDLPDHKPPLRADINDLAMIYLGTDSIKYGKHALPICIPYDTGNKEELAECSLQLNEEVHIAGYGVAQYYKRQNPGTGQVEEVIVDSSGLTRARYYVRGVILTDKYYFSSVYIAKAICRQKPNLKQRGKLSAAIRRLVNKNAFLKGAGPGDSGAPWLARRQDRDTRESRVFAMALSSISTSTSKSRGLEKGEDLLFYGKWILDTMKKFMVTAYSDTLV